MPNEVNNQEQTFLFDLLRATHQNQEIYSLLEQNLDKLNHNLALIVRKWTAEQFKYQPNTAINLAKVILKFSKFIQGFEKGNIASNLEIAIAGYEAVLKVCSREVCPQEWDSIQQALVVAYSQRHQFLCRRIEEFRENSIQNHTQINFLVEHLQQELQQSKQKYESLQIAITQLEQEKNTSNNIHITSLTTDLEELKQRHLYLEREITQVQVSSIIEHFNTAIFYDIENLTMGRSNPNLNFSIKQIQGSIAELNIVNKISIQCAYTDWSDYRLRFLKNEIQELGIEPIQIFDYSYKKNAADIQLAIDVMQLAHTRPNLQVFVIVSGDGGFASLAKKLHEYGKIVIGCAYEGEFNRFLKSVCDRFIPLPNRQEKIENIVVKEETDNVINTSKNYKFGDIFTITKETLEILKNNNDQIRGGGILITQVHTFLKKYIPNFDQRWSIEENTNKLTSFLKKALEGTNMCLSSDNNKLILREISSTYANDSSNNNLEIITRY